MEYTKVSTFWKCMMNPDTVDMDDVTRIFLEHMNPNSCLANLDCQRLASDLDKAQEGAKHDCKVASNILGDLGQDLSTFGLFSRILKQL